MSDLIDTTEMYLRTIYELVEEGIVPLRARIAERLHQSGPTVSQTVARMERDGLLTVEGDRHLELTDEGMRLATRVMRKHRLAERLLTDVIGLDWELVHEEACRWEHVMSETVERRLVELLDHPTESPYGNPIPGLAELGESKVGEEFMDGVEALSDAASVEEGRVLVRRISEEMQKDELADERPAPGGCAARQDHHRGLHARGRAGRLRRRDRRDRARGGRAHLRPQALTTESEGGVDQHDEIPAASRVIVRSIRLRSSWGRCRGGIFGGMGNTCLTSSPSTDRPTGT